MDRPKDKAKKDMEGFKPSNDALDDFMMGDFELQAKRKAAENETEKEPDKEQQESESEENKLYESVDDDAESIDDITKPVEPEVMDEVEKGDDKEVILDKKKENSGIRAQLEKANKRAEDTAFEVKRIEAEKAELEKKVLEYEARIADAEDASTRKDVSRHPEIRSMVDAWDRELSSLAQEISLSGGKGEKLRAEASELIQEYARLGSPSSEGYEERRQSFADRIDEDYHEDKRDVIGIIRRGSEALAGIHWKMEDLRKNADTYQYKFEHDQYERSVESYKGVEKFFFDPGEEMAESNPLHYRVLFSDLIKGNEKMAEAAKTAKSFARFALNPLPPINPAELASMDEGTARSYVDNHRRKHDVAMANVRKTYAEGLFALRVVPVMAKQLAEMKDRLAMVKEATPSPKVGDIVRDFANGEGKTIKDFKPVEPELDF